MATLPTLDFQDYVAGGDRRASFLKTLGETAREVGFFYLTGHGVPLEVSDGLVSLARKFFALPQAEKEAIDIANSPHFRGYTRIGNEHTRGRRDWRQQIDFGVDRPAIPQDGQQPLWTRLQGPNQWPAALPELEPAVRDWQARLEAVSVQLLEAFALALELPADAFSAIYREQPNHRLKVIHYPGRDIAEDEQGVGAHKDGGFLTLLLQDRQAGLQVETDAGWVTAAPIRGSFVVNIGELLELATNGYLRATTHRVVAPPAGVDRISIAFFFAARLDTEIPLVSLPAHLAALARGPASDPLNPMFRDTGLNQLKQRLRSHPDVAQRHYADILHQFGL
ncbi:isopenicillin N synthase family dioxygenase [Oceanibaculum pacificum]|uniref:2-oxobutyrate oxidase n=1 Tax=Oceanibaculum pacificum TaxID=580166 RepID=A0A154W1R2_9PROT|nr:2-oxoglutarate and iron-dependent oxygenase domain-containing protein [Oceanibaculum pacificum]KZD07391.1 2-oxobutyrate oxidase [Oceanibaculum pacificum]